MIMEFFLLLISVVSFVFAFVYPVILVYEKKDPWHRIFAQAAGIQITMHLKFIPLLSFIGLFNGKHRLLLI